MIKNERQRRSVAKQCAELRHQLSRPVESPDGDPLTALSERVTRGRLSELEAELAAYDGLRDASVLRFERFDQLPTLLIRARIAQGMTQADLARRLGVAPQQVQRDEAEEYGSASFGRLEHVARVLGAARVAGEVELERHNDDGAKKSRLGTEVVALLVEPANTSGPALAAWAPAATIKVGDPGRHDILLTDPSEERQASIFALGGWNRNTFRIRIRSGDPLRWTEGTDDPIEPGRWHDVHAPDETLLTDAIAACITWSN